MLITSGRINCKYTVQSIKETFLKVLTMPLNAVLQHYQKTSIRKCILHKTITFVFLECPFENVRQYIHPSGNELIPRRGGVRIMQDIRV